MLSNVFSLVPANRFFCISSFVFAFLVLFAVSPESLYAQDAVVSQCANDGDGSNDTCADGNGIGWINANVNANKGDYNEGDFLPARQILTGLTAGNKYCFGFGWDVTQGSRPAVDYIGSYDVTLPNADPTINTIHSGNGLDETIAIPTDPALSGTIQTNPFSGSQQAGMISLWGGTFDASSLKYSYASITAHPAASPQSLEYCITATATEAILAFGLHIAVGAEWGGLPRPNGSPYHVSNGTRNGQFTNPIRGSETDLACQEPDGTVSGGNIGRKEAQMAVGAIESGTIKIVKQIANGDDETFGFDLQDGSGSIPLPSITTSGGMGMSSVIVVDPGTFSIEEIALPAGWAVVAADTSCVPDGSGTTGTLSGETISNISVANGENIVCTFTNEDTTFILLSKFSAMNTIDGATISWTTASEVDNAGFNIYRSGSTDGPWVQVNEALIPAHGNALSVANYILNDGVGAAYYMLEDVDINGIKTQHGPILNSGGNTNGLSSNTTVVFLPMFY